MQLYNTLHMYHMLSSKILHNVISRDVSYRVLNSAIQPFCIFCENIKSVIFIIVL